MIEKEKTIFDYLAQVFMLYGLTVCIFIVFGLVFGEYNREISTLFALGKEGLSFSTLLQLFGMTILIILIRNIFFSDRLIRNMSVVKRAVCMLTGIIVTIIVFVIAFDWFPVRQIEAWIGFAVSFGICFAISMGVTILKEKTENRKMEEALKKMNETE